MQTEKRKILLIDDEKELCTLVKLNLEKTGEFQVRKAYSGEEGIEKLKKYKFDIIIIDHNLPGISGIEVIDIINKMKIPTPVVLFSIYHDDNSEIPAAMHEKIAGIIKKPFGHHDIYRLLKDILNKE